MKVRVIKLTAENEAALKWTLEQALRLGDWQVSENAIIFKKILENSPVENVPEAKKEEKKK